MFWFIICTNFVKDEIYVSMKNTRMVKNTNIAACLFVFISDLPGYVYNITNWGLCYIVVNA